MTVGGSQPQPIVGEGDLNYTMVVQPGNLGGTTNISINAEHNFDGIAPTSQQQQQQQQRPRSACRAGCGEEQQGQ